MERKLSKPTDTRGEVFQCLLLPLLPAGRGFDNPVFDLFEQFRAFELQPGQDVFGQPAVMGAGFRNPQSAIRNPQLLQPFGKLAGEDLAEESADADTGVKIAMAPRIVFFCFIVSMNWTIKGEFHETCKG